MIIKYSLSVLKKRKNSELAKVFIYISDDPLLTVNMYLCPQDDISESLLATERKGVIRGTDEKFVYIEDDLSGCYVSKQLQIFVHLLNIQIKIPHSLKLTIKNKIILIVFPFIKCPMNPYRASLNFELNWCVSNHPNLNINQHNSYIEDFKQI